MKIDGLYSGNDLANMQDLHLNPIHVHILKSLDELLARDEKRKEDGFPKKIRLGKLLKPTQSGKPRVVIVPTVVEEKFIHDTRAFIKEEETGGAGEEQEGEVIGEEPVHSTQDGSGTGSGQGEEAVHEIESSAYDLGRILTEKFRLPNLKEKGKKRSLTKYTYELTDKNKGFGQVLDKKASLKKIIETNLALGNIKDFHNIDPDGLIVSPDDKIYRTLSRERDFESQALVFFVRDYSGSMSGNPTELIVSQHLLIYSWLMFQYQGNVETRFILHDDKAKEVDDFYTYYNTSVAGGTKLASAYRLINSIVQENNLIRDYNIYIFQGTDGEDWDVEGIEAIEELNKIIIYVSRIGITIAQNIFFSSLEGSSLEGSVVERYMQKSGLLKNDKAIRMDVLSANSDQDRVIEGIRKLVSENGTN
jgi:uncharacterized sporulation protein YeaH/YhbH (DUF444 family)